MEEADDFSFKVMMDRGPRDEVSRGPARGNRWHDDDFVEGPGVVDDDVEGPEVVGLDVVEGPGVVDDDVEGPEVVGLA